jgi:hypothetical protein
VFADVGVEVLPAVTVTWDVTLWCPVEVSACFSLVAHLVYIQTWSYDAWKPE